jgi:DnaJ domain
MSEDVAAASSDPYETLQVSPGASADVIRAAYRVLARSYHPDVNGSPVAARRMAELNAAYAVVMDPVRRAEYDAKHAPAQRARSAGRVRPARVIVTAPPPHASALSGGRLPIPQLLGALSLAIVICALVIAVFTLAFSMLADALGGPALAPPPSHGAAVVQDDIQPSRRFMDGSAPDQPVLNRR